MEIYSKGTVMKIRALAIISALALPSFALADKTPADTTTKTDKPDPASAKLSDGDTKIVAHLHHVNQMESDLGTLAQKVGTATGKTYGEILVADHQRADTDLTSFAKAHKLATIPADKPMTDADKQEAKMMETQVAKLKTLKGAEFDRELLTMMAAGHDKELAKIDVAMGAATDPDLQSMLKAVKPVLQRHADQARDLQSKLQASCPAACLEAAAAPDAPDGPCPLV